MTWTHFSVVGNKRNELTYAVTSPKAHAIFTYFAEEQISICESTETDVRTISLMIQWFQLLLLRLRVIVCGFVPRVEQKSKVLLSNDHIPRVVQRVVRRMLAGNG